MNKPEAPAEPFPWDRVITIGLGLLRLQPSAFWAMTPREFALAARLGRGGADTVPDRRDLARLMAAFPD